MKNRLPKEKEGNLITSGPGMLLRKNLHAGKIVQKPKSM